MTAYELIGVFETGFIFSLVALSAFLSFRVLNFPDLTVEGSFPLGAAVCAVLIVGGVNAWLATAAAALAGFAAGYVTAFLNVRMRILPILAGILVAISLYSINLRIMSGPNKPLLGLKTVFDLFPNFGLPASIANLLLLLLIVLSIMLLLNAFLATGYGMAMRATGMNPAMAEANGVNAGSITLLGIGLANAMTSLAGALFAQSFGTADAYMGIGVVIVGFASVILGTSLIPARSMLAATSACIVGAIVYRFAVAISLNGDYFGLVASDVQLVTAVIVVLALFVQRSGLPIAALFRRNRRKVPAHDYRQQEQVK